MFAKLFFLYCAGMIGSTALLAVQLRNPVHSLLMVLVLFFHLAAIYLTLGAEFLAAVQVIVYAGAVLVLYLFVLFLVHLRDEVRVERFVDSRALAAVFAGGLLLMLLAILPAFKAGPHGNWPIETIQRLGHTRIMGLELFSTSLLPFEIAGLILLIGVLGGMVLARRQQDIPAPRGLEDKA